MHPAVLQIEKIEYSHYSTDSAVLFETGSQRKLKLTTLRKRMIFQVIIMIYDHLRNIDLLKNSEGDSASIDVLIGNDFYYSFSL